MPGDPFAQSTASLVQFLAGGIVHGMSNSLFAIQGHAQMLRGGEAEIAGARAAIAKATEKALKALDVFRYVIGGGEHGPPPQAGILLHRLCEYVRGGLAERGVRVRFVPGAGDAPQCVDGTVLCQSVAEVLRQLTAVLPVASESDLSVEVVAQRKDAVVIELRLDNRPAVLPFPIDLQRVMVRARPVLDLHHVRADLAGSARQLRLALPVVPHASAAASLGAESV
jgi:hypothetical protein